jgi:hypothetical protein
MFERFTEKARRVVFFSRYEASQAGSPYIESEHLLLGLLREASYAIDKLLRQRGRRDELAVKAREFSERLVRQQVSTSVDLPLSNECKRILAYTAEEAERLSDRHIGTEHMLLGILREEHCFAAKLLFEFGVRLEYARDHFKDESTDLPRTRTLKIAEHRPDGCTEFVNQEGKRVGISGIGKVVPRVGEFVCLRRQDEEITYRVVRVTYDYYPEPPGSPHAADELRSIRIMVTVADSTYEGGSIPVDAT